MSTYLERVGEFVRSHNPERVAEQKQVDQSRSMWAEAETHFKAQAQACSVRMAAQPMLPDIERADRANSKQRDFGFEM